MKDLPKLDFFYADEGWNKSEGKSFNVWGRVPYPQEILDYQNEHKNVHIHFYDGRTGRIVDRENSKGSVWTAFDKYIYSKHNVVRSNELPRISATFKSCFNKYGAVCENLGMRIAMALDMPTSYNYLVEFDPSEYPEIVNNYPRDNARRNLQPVGVVVIDFLQNVDAPETKSRTSYVNSQNEVEEIDSISRISGDVLETFEDCLRKYGITHNNMDGRENLIEYWIKAVDAMVQDKLADCPREIVNKRISNIHSRIARSFLLREFLGDCDFTAYNGGVVTNKATMKMDYAPNHDYGECFNGLIKLKLDFKPDPYCGMSKEFFESLPLATQESIKKSQQKTANLSVEDIARQYASGASEQNLNYVLKNFPEACKEFFENLDHLVQLKGIDDIIDSYAELSCKGVPLLTDQERLVFKEYINERLVFMCELYVKHLHDNNMEVPQSIIDADSMIY